MSTARLASAPGYLRTLARSLGDPTADGELLERFASGREEAAFATLLERHGRMVLGVCRRLLGHEQDAEDAFQATFLLLARNSGRIRQAGSVAAWLHGAARRIAGKSRRAAARRLAHERRAAVTQEARPNLDAASRELRAVLDEELAALPGRCRDALVLCYLEGLTLESAAVRLGCPRGTVASRLAHGRALLRDRLARRGLDLSAGALAVLLLGGGASASIPPTLSESTRLAALASASGVVGKPMWFLALMLSLALGVGAALMKTLPAAPPATLSVGRAEAPLSHAPPVRLDLHGDPLPAGASLRLGTVRLRRDDQSSSSLAFTPDGKALVSARTDKAVQFSDATTRRPLFCLRQTDRLDVFALSSNGKVLATAGSWGIAAWDVARRKQAWTARSKDVTAVAVAPDGKRVASGGKDKTVRVWDAKGNEVLTLLGHKSAVTALAFSADGKTLISSGGASVRFHDGATGRPLRTLKPAEKPVRCLALSRNGKVLATVGAGLTLWETATGRMLWQAKEKDRAGSPSGVAFSADGSLLASACHIGGAAKIHLWEARTGKFLRQIDATGWNIASLAFSPDGATLASTEQGVHSVIDLWDVKSGKPLRPAGPTGGYKAIAFSPDGRLIATGPWLGHGGEPLRIWNGCTGQVLRSCEGRHQFFQVAFTPDGKGVFGVTAGGMIRLWDSRTGKKQWEAPAGKKAREEPGGDPTGIAFSADRKTLYVLTNGAFTGWDLAKSKRLFQRDAFTSFLNTATLSPDGTLSVEQDGTCLHIREMTTGRRTGSLELTNASRGERFCELFSFSPDGRILAAVTDLGWSNRGRGYEPVECSVRLWELATGQEILSIGGIRSWVRAVGFAPDGRTLATAGEGLTQLWDTATGKELLARRGHDGRVMFTALAFAPDGKRLAVGYSDSTTLLWDLPLGLKRTAGKLGKRQFEELWARLAASSAARGQGAVWALAAAAEQAIPRLKERLEPAKPIDPSRIRRLLDDLDSSRFSVREAAEKRLAKELEQSVQAEAFLRAALAKDPEFERRRRLERLLSRQPRLTAGSLQEIRAIQVLEAVGTKEARGLLEALSRGAPAGRRTLAAKAALQRLAHRTVP